MPLSPPDITATRPASFSSRGEALSQASGRGFIFSSNPGCRGCFCRGLTGFFLRCIWGIGAEYRKHTPASLEMRACLFFFGDLERFYLAAKLLLALAEPLLQPAKQLILLAFSKPKVVVGE